MRFFKLFQIAIIRNFDVFMRISHFLISLMKTWEKAVIRLIVFVSLWHELLMSPSKYCTLFSLFVVLKVSHLLTLALRFLLHQLGLHMLTLVLQINFCVSQSTNPFFYLLIKSRISHSVVWCHQKFWQL